MPSRLSLHLARLDGLRDHDDFRLAWVRPRRVESGSIGVLCAAGRLDALPPAVSDAPMVQRAIVRHLMAERALDALGPGARADCCAVLPRQARQR